MTRKRLRVSKIDGRRYRYPYPVYYRPPLRWITPSFTAKKVTVVARDFGPEILRAIHHNDLEFLQRILENRLRANSLITKLCMMDVSRGAASRRVSCPLIAASQKKDPTILRYMLEKGADPNYVKYTSHPPHSYCALHTAAKLGLLKTADTLLCFKANPNAIDSRGETPLLIAVRTCNCALAKLLLSHGADPNARDMRGCTSLHIATSHGHLEMASLLLSYNADLKLPNRNGALPVHIAASAGHAHLIRDLFVMDAASANATCLLDGITLMPLHQAAENGHVEVVTALLDLKANVNAKDSEGNTALHHAVLKPYQANTMRSTNQFFATALALLKAGIVVNDKNNRGETALVLAASNQFPRVAKLILSSAGTELNLEPEMLQQILLEQDIVTTKNENETTIGKHTDHVADTSSKQMLSSNGKTKSFPAETSDISNRLEQKGQEIKTFAEESTSYSQAPTESHPLKEIQPNVADSHPSVSNAQAPDVFTKRYPLPKSDLRNYQQFRPGPTIENEISTFTVTANKGAERMCILFDKNSPSNKKVTSTKKGSENEFKPYTQKKSISTSTDVTKPVTKRLKSTDGTTEETVPKQKDSLGRSLSSPEQKQLPESKNDQKRDPSKISPPRISDLDAEEDESVEKHHQLPVTDESEEEGESCWITCRVEKDNLQYPVAPRNIRKYSAPSFRHYNKSPSGFLSEGGGLRRLRLRVSGEVPKAYTCKQKAAKRKAFILAHPVGIESTGDYDRTHLSMSSLPELGGVAWEKAMQRRLEWTEPLKPVFTKQKTPPSRKFSPTSSPRNLNRDGSKQSKGDYRIAGLFPQPYKSFGKIETKTDAIEEALKDYDSEEEYQSDNDIEPLTKRWVNEVTERQWHLIPSESAEGLNTSTDDVERVNILDISIDESISSVEAEEIAGIISNGYIVETAEDDKNLEQHLIDEGTDTEGELAETEEEEEEMEEHEDQAHEENKQKSEVEQRNQANEAQSQATPGKSGVSLLQLLHGYHGKGASSEGSTMVVSNLEPEIQRLTIENIVLADDSTSDDEEYDETSERTSNTLPKQSPVNDFSELGKGDTSKQQKGNDIETPVNQSALEHKDKEIEEMLKSTEGHPSIPTQISNFVQEKVHQDQRQATEDKENELETEERHERKDLSSKSSKFSPRANGEEPDEAQKLDNKERLTERDNLEEPKKKGKKGKQSSKKQRIAAKDSGEYEDAVGEVIQVETAASELPVKRKKKSKSKVPEKEPSVAEPELKPPSQNEENMVTEDASKSQIPSVWSDGNAIDEEMTHNVYAEEPTRRRRKTDENLITEYDDQKMQKQLRGKEQTDETMYNVYSEEPGRRGRQDRDKIKIKESDERRDQSQDHIAEDNDSEQLKTVKENITDDGTKPREMQSEEKDANINNVEYLQQVYDEEPGLQRKSSKREKASERGKDEIPDHREELENELERLSQDELASEAITTKSRKAKKKQNKGKDIAELVQIEDADKAEENDELQKPSKLKPGGKRKPATTQKEATIPAEIEFNETQTETGEVLETFAVEDSQYSGKPDKKKQKKKVKGKVEEFIEQQQGASPDHSIPAESFDEQNNLVSATNEVGDEDSTSVAIKKQDGTSIENVSESIGEESRLTEPIKSRGIKAKKSKKTVGKDVVLNNNWGINSVVNSEVWQEAMNEEPLASSETVYDVMHDAEKAKVQKKAKKKSALGKKLKNTEAETIPVEDLSIKALMVKDVEGKPNSGQPTNNLVQTSNQRQISFPVRPAKETDIDDTLEDMEHDRKTSNMADSLESQKATEARKAAEHVRVTMETSVDDIMDELVESKDDMTSSGVKLTKAELVRKWHKPTETSIDDLGELPPHPEADGTEPYDSEADLKVERSLETNVDEYAEEPFVRRSMQKSNKAMTDIEKSRPLNLGETVESKASKVTNVDDYQAVPTPFGVEIKLKQPDGIFSHMADTQGTTAPENSERLEAVEPQKSQRYKKGTQKKTKLGAKVQQTRVEEKYRGQSEMQELQNAEENHVADSEEEEELTREEKKKQMKIAEEELNEVTYLETGGAEEIENVRHQKKKQKQIRDKAMKERAEGNLEDTNEQTKMQKKKASEAVYEDTGVDEELNSINKEIKIGEEKDDIRTYRPKRYYVREAPIREAGIDEDIESQDAEEATEVKESVSKDIDTDEDLDDEYKQKLQREQIIKIKRFGEDSSLSEESYEKLQGVENAPKTFKIGSDTQKKMLEKSTIKKEKPETEMGTDEDFGDIKRRKKTRKPVVETTYKETGIDEDLDDIKRQEKKQRVRAKERDHKENEADNDMDDVRIYPQKLDSVRGVAVRETGIDEDIESQDEEETTEVKESGYKETGTDEDFDEDKQKLQRGQIIKIKRFGEDSSLSEESYEKLQEGVENAPKTFKIGSDTQKKMLEKSIIKKEKPETEMGTDEDFGDIKRRKKTRKPVAETTYKETSIDEDFRDIKEQEKNQIARAKGKDHKETSVDEDFDDDAEMKEIQTKQMINIRRSGEDFSLQEDSDDKVQQDAKNAAKTFKIGINSKKEIEGKLAEKTSRPMPDTEVGIDEDYGEIKRRKKTRKPVAERTYMETGIDDDLDDTKIRHQEEGIEHLQDIPYEETEEYDKVPAQRVTKLQRFKEDSSFSEESDDNLPKDVENVPKSFQTGTEFLASGRKIKELVATKQKELNSRERNAHHFKKAESKSTDEEEWTDERSEEEEETEKPASELTEMNRRRMAKEIASKTAFESHKYQSEQQEEQVSEEETSNKEIESDEEEANNLEHKKRIKAVHVTRERPTDRLNFSSIKQNNKILSETNFDHLSESDDSDEHHIRVTEKVEALLSKKKSFNEQEFDLIEENQVQTPDIASFMDTDDDSHYKKSIQKEKTENVETTTSDTVTKKQQWFPKNGSNAFETDDSEEVAGSFSRRQVGRVSRGRVKKGTKKIQDPTLEPSSNADTEGSSKGDLYEDNRMHSAEIPKGKKWYTEETDITETKLTSQQGQKTLQSISKAKASENQQIGSYGHKSTPSAVKSNAKLQEDAKDKISQQTRPSNQPSTDLDLEESIRRKRQMEMTEVVTTTVTTSAVQDNLLNEKVTDVSSYSLPNPPVRKPPQKRDIKPLNTLNTSAPLPQETSFDVELSPAPKNALDNRLSEVTLSKTDPFKRNSMDISLLRKSTTTERTFQQRSQRQHSVDSLNRHRPRPQTNEFEVKKSHSDANLARRKRYSVRSRSTGHLDLRTHYNGLYRTQREQAMRPLKFKQPNKTLQEAALEIITASTLNEPRLLKKRQLDDGEKPIVYTRGIYRPQPVYWRGSSHGANANNESRISTLQAQEPHSLNESTEDTGNKTADSLDKSKQNGNTDSNPASPPQLSLSKDGDDLENRNSAFATYNKRVTIHEEQRPQQFYGRRRHRQPRTIRPSREEPYKAPQITEPIAVDFSKYGILAQLWMEQVDMKTVLKSKTMYLSIMPAGVQPPEEITKSIKYVPTGEDLTVPAQWIIARGRSIRQQKRQMDEYHHRMSESYFLSGGDSDLDLSRGVNPMSPGKQSLLFFKVGGRWLDLAWVLFEGVQSDAATIRMIKDIQLKNPDRLTDQIQDLMSRWWKQKGQAATIEELKRSLELINLPFVQDETLNITMANSFFNTSDLENKLACEEVEAADPEVSRMIQEYNQRSHNASFNVEHRQSPLTAQPFSSDALLRQMQQKGLLTHSSPNLRNSQLKPGDNRDSNLGRNDTQDGSFIRLHSHNGSLRMSSSQDSLNTENMGDDNKRKSFTIVQPQLKTLTGKKFRHESNF